jgi:dynein heavy chain
MLGMHCLVINGSGDFEYDVLTKMFKGAACSGAWLVFDEFNRLDWKRMNFLALIIT